MHKKYSCLSDKFCGGGLLTNVHQWDTMTSVSKGGIGMTGFNAFAHQSSSRCAAEACAFAPICTDLDTANVLVVSIFVADAGQN